MTEMINPERKKLKLREIHLDFSRSLRAKGLYFCRNLLLFGEALKISSK
jgi:hypothetical protein